MDATRRNKALLPKKLRHVREPRQVAAARSLDAAVIRRSAARNLDAAVIRRSASAVKNASAATTANALLRRSAARNASVEI